jgi:hypothetical protein
VGPPADEGSRITRMKGGTTHPACKGGHAVGPGSGRVLAAAASTADQAGQYVNTPTVGPA